MNLLLLTPDERNDFLVLSGPRFHHIKNVLRAKPGDHLRLGVINGPTGVGRITAITDHNVSIQVSLADQEPERPPIDLILALPRPIMLQRICTIIPGFGVASLHLIRARRVEKSYYHSSLLADRHYEAYLLQGMSQAVTTWLPQVHIHHRFNPFIQDLAPQLRNNSDHHLLAHPGSAQHIAHCRPLSTQDRFLVAIGPEGGWVDYEIEQFQAQGFTPFQLGTGILRVETAVTAILSQLALVRQLTAP